MRIHFKQLRKSWKQAKNHKVSTDLVLWQRGLALSIRCLALALTVVAPHWRATRGGRHARHGADLGNLGLLGSAGQEENHSHLSCGAEGREAGHTRKGHKLEIWACRWDHCITWSGRGRVKVRKMQFARWDIQMCVRSFVDTKVSLSATEEIHSGTRDAP